MCKRKRKDLVRTPTVLLTRVLAPLPGVDPSGPTEQFTEAGCEVNPGRPSNQGSRYSPPSGLMTRMLERGQ